MLAGAALVAIGANTADAQQTGSKPRVFRTPTMGAGVEVVSQGGPEAEEIRKALASIVLPRGFKIELFALVPEARHMAISASGRTVFVGSRTNRFWVVLVAEDGVRVSEVRNVAPSLSLRRSHGVCFARDGTLYVVELNRVLAFPAAEKSVRDRSMEFFEVVRQGQLIPPEEESPRHSKRTCKIGPDDRLYVTLGQPYNVTPKNKLDLYDRTGIGGIVRMNRLDGSGREVFVRGARNSVGLAFNPLDGSLWWTDNQVDGMGDDVPPGELNRAVTAGSHFGFPWFGGGKVRTHEYMDSNPPPGIVFPEVEMAAHAADLGLAFYTGTAFPKRYRGGIFSAQHGSWDRSTPIGARIMFTSLGERGLAERTEVFGEGWLDPATGKYMGRPVDVGQLPDGSILVSDDFAGAIYRITYVGQ